MKDIQYSFLGLAITATICLMLIAIFIAEKSVIGVILAIIALIVTMGIGFSRKKKLREK